MKTRVESMLCCLLVNQKLKETNPDSLFNQDVFLKHNVLNRAWKNSDQDGYPFIKYEFLGQPTWEVREEKSVQFGGQQYRKD